MNPFHIKENTWIESLIFALFVHILLLTFILTSSELIYLAQLSEKIAKDNPQSLLLVDLEDTQEQTPIDSFIVSDNALKGSGKLRETDDKRPHLLGEFKPPSDGSPTDSQALSPQSPHNPTANDTPHSNNPSPANTTTPPQKASTFELIANTDPSLRFTDAPYDLLQPKLEQNTQNSPQAPQPPLSRSGLETENTTNFRFYVDENPLQQANIAKDIRAQFFLDIKHALSHNLQLYANNFQGAGSINYYYLKTGEVSAIMTIDRRGNMRFEQLIQDSTTQPYYNYLIERITSRDQAIQNFPIEFLQSDQAHIYLKISLDYKGPPLYQWWVSLKILNLDIE